ncbi:1-phosphofructokinase [Gracilibacillus marinus]|uniref:Tagatose-6-phosphate kinase n=1 Tax=Gracilibacillus marinus TaxID=630535 RepID=A0ABV8VP99_9BACI
MIYTVTFNPAVDYVVQLDQFHQGEVNRSKYDYKEAGGKGINVSRVLRRLGLASDALGFAGGFTGKFVTDFLNEEKITHHFIELEEDTRINVKWKANEIETEVNGKSPTITNAHYEQFTEMLKKLQDGDIVVLAGSLPQSLQTDTYRTLVKMLHEHNVKVFLDTSGLALAEAIKAGPFFVKPNHHELAELFQEKVETEKDIIRLAKRLQEEYHIAHVLISMAGDGAIYVNGEASYKLTAPKGEVVHSVGAGDSAVAGFLYKWHETNNGVHAATYAIASGSATAFSETLCIKEEVESLLQEVHVSEL